MKANNITVSIPTKPCKIGCPYCVTNMTFPVEDNIDRFLTNLNKAVKLAERSGVSHVLITSKGEPLDNPAMVQRVCDSFKDFPIELQTNYLAIADFNDNKLLFDDIDIIAISVDSPIMLSSKNNLRDFFLHRETTNYITRATIVLNKSFNGWDLNDFITVCKRYDIKQLTIRQPSIPSKINIDDKSLKTINWIEKNIDPMQYDMILSNLDRMVREGNARFIRKLGFGAEVYNIDEIGFVAMRYCVESENTETMRSLIYQSDGHIYTTWDHSGSIIF